MVKNIDFSEDDKVRYILHMSKYLTLKNDTISEIESLQTMLKTHINELDDLLASR